MDTINIKNNDIISKCDIIINGIPMPNNNLKIIDNSILKIDNYTWQTKIDKEWVTEVKGLEYQISYQDINKKGILSTALRKDPKFDLNDQRNIFHQFRNRYPLCGADSKNDTMLSVTDYPNLAYAVCSVYLGDPMKEKIVVYHGTNEGEIYDLEKDPDEFENLWDQPNEQARKMRLLQWCFDTSVFTMDPMPPRLGPF